MKEDELFDPVPKLVRFWTIVSKADSGAELVNQLRLVHEGSLCQQVLVYPVPTSAKLFVYMTSDLEVNRDM